MLLLYTFGSLSENVSLFVIFFLRYSPLLIFLPLSFPLLPLLFSLPLQIELFNAVARNGYKVLYLSARAIGQVIL